jgi:hypothetical protein
MCNPASTYVKFYNPPKLKKLLADIAEAELELEQARSSPTPSKDLILHLTEYLVYLQSKFSS